MKILIRITLCLLLAWFVLVPMQAGAADLPEIDPILKSADKLKAVQNDLRNVRVILTYDDRPTSEDVAALRDRGLKTHTFDHLPMIAVQGPYTAIQELFDQDHLRSIFADKKLDYLLKDSVPYIEADRVWSELGYTGKNVGVAIIDSGVDALHQDLSYGEKTVQNVKILSNNFFTDEMIVQENLPNTDTTSGHGTHVAGIIGGTGAASNGTYKGVAPDSNLIGIGAGDALFILYALEGFDYAIENQERYGIDVISNSWGTTGEYTPNDPVNVASKVAHDKGMTVVFAAGNEGPEENTLNPYSVAPWVIGVAAGTKDGKLADFSSRGIPGDKLYHPTLTAPGVDIVSTRASTGSTINALTAATDATYIPPQYIPFYTTASGTSMATPHISGVVALMKEANPELTPDVIKDVLIRTARPMEGYQEYEVGAGYVDAYDAAALAKKVKVKAPKGGGTEKEVPTYSVTETWSGEIGPSADGTPVEDKDEKILTIDKKAVSATVRIDWTNPATDLDLYVYGPDGSLVGKSAQGVTDFEETTILDPAAGEYKVVIEGYLSTVEPYEGTATIDYALR
ncbi:serine protease AprX [Melghirimyces profundicolus]|uniref:Serine protease AprX n=1 Tax=Melghirimyces profundicolus TaxID=1242148 RepID=A0A2T6C7V9_9BACL|nr:S8 family serine peptidase [Melghirimyces profundicolus]PTX64410.1 serine protease AprX [Melghirimyces profundicolus]